MSALHALNQNTKSDNRWAHKFFQVASHYIGYRIVKSSSQQFESSSFFFAVVGFDSVLLKCSHSHSYLCFCGFIEPKTFTNKRRHQSDKHDSRYTRTAQRKKKKVRTMKRKNIFHCTHDTEVCFEHNSYEYTSLFFLVAGFHRSSNVLNFGNFVLYFCYLIWWRSQRERDGKKKTMRYICEKRFEPEYSVIRIKNYSPKNISA